MGIVTVSSETAFRHPPEAVYDFVTDPRNWTKVYPGQARIAGIDTLPVPLGAEWREGSAPRVFTWKLLTAVRPTRWMFQSVGRLAQDPSDPQSGFEGLMTVTYTFSAPGEGVSLFHRQMSLEMPKRAEIPDNMIRVFEPRFIDAYHDAVAKALAG